jgi:hypothetical protein
VKLLADRFNQKSSRSSGVMIAQAQAHRRRKGMSEVYSGRPDSGATRYDRRNSAALGAAGWLGLAAAPTFAIMALLTGVLSDGKMAIMCSTAQDPSPLGGMVPMYLLMSAFHSAPWLKLIANRRRRARAS